MGESNLTARTGAHSGTEYAKISVTSKSSNPSPPLIMERLGKLNQSDRSFDVEFWQRQGSTAIFAAAWEMVVEANQWKKKSDSELAFQRTVESLKSLRS